MKIYIYKTLQLNVKVKFYERGNSCTLLKDMLDKQICELRNKLNESILNGDDYSITYKLSIELDELIAQYYRKN